MGIHNVAKGHYVGAARFLELAPPGIHFRGLTNVDHITSITFAQKIDDIEVPDKVSADSAAGVPPPTHTEQRVTGFVVTVGIGGSEQAFTFARPDAGIAYYNQLLGQMVALGVPCALQPRVQLQPPPKPETPAILDADGKALEAANIEAGDEGEDLEDPVLIDEFDEIAEEVAADQIEAEDEPTQH